MITGVRLASYWLITGWFLSVADLVLVHHWLDRRVTGPMLTDYWPLTGFLLTDNWLVFSRGQGGPRRRCRQFRSPDQLPRQQTSASLRCLATTEGRAHRSGLRAEGWTRGATETG